MSRGSKAAERSLPPEVAPIDTFEEQHLMFIRGTASSLPELTHVGSRNKQQSDSVYGLKDQEQSKASLPFLSLTGYGGSHDGLPRKGMTHTGVVSPAAARRRNKLAAQRALGLSSQSGKRQQRRHKGNNNNLAAEESISSPHMRYQPTLTSSMKIRAGLDVVKSSVLLSRVNSNISSTGELIDSVEDLIDDVVLKEDEELAASEHITEKIVSLPVLVCYGSNSVVLMDTKHTAAVLREKRMQKLAGNGTDSRRLMSPAVPDRLPIPAHWPGEPEWLKQQAAKQDSERALPVHFNEECKDPSQTEDAMRGRSSPTRRKSFRKPVFEDGEQKLAFARSISKRGYPRQISLGPSSSAEPGLAFEHPHDALEMSAKAMKRKASAENWKTPKNLVQYVEKEDPSSDEEEQDLAGGHAALTVDSLRNVTGWDPLPQDNYEEVSDSAPLPPRDDELGGFTDYENEDEESREERWAAELLRFNLLAEKLELPKHEDYCYSGSFGRPTAQYAEQHRYVRHLMKCNPAAFDAEAAQIQEQALHQELQDAKITASMSMYKPGRNMEKVHPVFMKQLHELRSARPALVWPDLHRVKREKAHERSRDRNGHAKNWELMNSIFAARYKDYTPNFHDIEEDHLLFDFERQSKEFYSRFTKKPVKDRHHPSCKERIDMVADALHQAGVYLPLCQAFYSYAVSDALGPDRDYLLSFEGFESACKQLGLARVVELEIQGRIEDGEIPTQFVILRETANLESADGDKEGSTSQEGDDVTTAPHRSSGSFSSDKGHQALSGGEGNKNDGSDAVDLAKWKTFMLAKLFRPSPVPDGKAEQRAIKTPAMEDLTFRELRALQASGKEGASQLMKREPPDDIATRRRHPINRTEWMDCCMEIAALKYIHRDERFRGRDPTTSDPVEALKYFVDRDLKKFMPKYVFVNVESVRESFYTGKVEVLLRLNHELIKAMFEMYKAKDRTANLRLDHWMHMMSDLKIVGERLGVTELQAKLLFVDSSMAVTPPTPEHLREPTLRIHDFLEALARLSDAVWLPTPEDVKSGYRTEPIRKDPDSGFHLCDFVIHAPVQALHRRELRQSRTSDTERPKPASRPMHETLSRLFVYMTGALCRYWDLDSCSTGELVDHLHAVRATVWRWGGQTQASFRANRSMLPSGGAEGSDNDDEDKGGGGGL